MNICKMISTMPGNTASTPSIVFPHYYCGTQTGWGQGATCAFVIAEAKVHIVVIISEKCEGAGWCGSHESFVPGSGHLRAERMQVAQHRVVMIRFT